jgi:hypothetical protein
LPERPENRKGEQHEHQRKRHVNFDLQPFSDNISVLPAEVVLKLCPGGEDMGCFKARNGRCDERHAARTAPLRETAKKARKFQYKCATVGPFVNEHFELRCGKFFNWKSHHSFSSWRIGVVARAHVGIAALVRRKRELDGALLLFFGWVFQHALGRTDRHTDTRVAQTDTQTHEHIP